MVINDDKGGLIFFRIRGKEERERERNRKGKNRGGIRPSSCGNPAPSPSHGNYLSLPSVLPPFFFPRIVEFRTILLSLFLSNPSLSLVCAKAPLPNLFSRVENLTVVEGQFVLLWEPRRDRTIKPRIRNWIVITLDGLEEEILFFFSLKVARYQDLKEEIFSLPRFVSITRMDGEEIFEGNIASLVWKTNIWGIMGDALN